MKRIYRDRRLAAVVFVFAAAGIMRGSGLQHSAPPAVADGRRIFNQSCAACHDTLGTSTKPGPRLKNYYHHQQRPADTTVRTIIHQGKGKMPAFSTLNELQTNDLIAYLRTL